MISRKDLFRQVKDERAVQECVLFDWRMHLNNQNSPEMEMLYSRIFPYLHQGFKSSLTSEILSAEMQAALGHDQSSDQWMIARLAFVDKEISLYDQIKEIAEKKFQLKHAGITPQHRAYFECLSGHLFTEGSTGTLVHEQKLKEITEKLISGEIDKASFILLHGQHFYSVAFLKQPQERSLLVLVDDSVGFSQESMPKIEKFFHSQDVRIMLEKSEEREQYDAHSCGIRSLVNAAFYALNPIDILSMQHQSKALFQDKLPKDLIALMYGMGVQVSTPEALIPDFEHKIKHYHERLAKRADETAQDYEALFLERIQNAEDLQKILEAIQNNDFQTFKALILSGANIYAAENLGTVLKAIEKSSPSPTRSSLPKVHIASKFRRMQHGRMDIRAHAGDSVIQVSEDSVARSNKTSENGWDDLAAMPTIKEWFKEQIVPLRNAILGKDLYAVAGLFEKAELPALEKVLDTFSKYVQNSHPPLIGKELLHQHFIQKFPEAAFRITQLFGKSLESHLLCDVLESLTLQAGNSTKISQLLAHDSLSIQDKSHLLQVALADKKYEYAKIYLEAGATINFVRQNPFLNVSPIPLRDLQFLLDSFKPHLHFKRWLQDSLIHASQGPHIEWNKIKLLDKTGANISKCGPHLFMEAAAAGQNGILTKMLANNPSLHHFLSDALGTALGHAQVNTADYLLKKGAKLADLHTNPFLREGHRISVEAFNKVADIIQEHPAYLAWLNEALLHESRSTRVQWQIVTAAIDRGAKLYNGNKNHTGSAANLLFQKALLDGNTAMLDKLHIWGGLDASFMDHCLEQCLAFSYTKRPENSLFHGSPRHTDFSTNTALARLLLQFGAAPLRIENNPFENIRKTPLHYQKDVLALFQSNQKLTAWMEAELAYESEQTMPHWERVKCFLEVLPKTSSLSLSSMENTLGKGLYQSAVKANRLDILPILEEKQTALFVGSEGYQPLTRTCVEIAAKNANLSAIQYLEERGALTATIVSNPFQQAIPANLDPLFAHFKNSPHRDTWLMEAFAQGLKVPITAFSFKKINKLFSTLKDHKIQLHGNALSLSTEEFKQMFLALHRLHQETFIQDFSRLCPSSPQKDYGMALFVQYLAQKNENISLQTFLLKQIDYEKHALNAFALIPPTLPQYFRAAAKKMSPATRKEKLQEALQELLNDYSPNSFEPLNTLKQMKVKLCLKNGGDMHTKQYGRSPLEQAIETGDPALLKCMLQEDKNKTLLRQHLFGESSPLCYLIRTQANPKIIALLTHKYPELLKLRDAKTQLLPQEYAATYSHTADLALQAKKPHPLSKLKDFLLLQIL